MRRVFVGGVGVAPMLLLLLMVFTSLCEGMEYCHVKAPSWTSDSQVHLSHFISLRKSDDKGCGEILPESLQNYVAVAWVIEKLNQGDGFIPGIKFDLELYDDCQSPVYATRNAMSVLSPSLSSKVTTCNQSDSSVHLGIIGPSRSETATQAARLLKTSNIPLISPSATVAELSNKTLYPNVFRTALPDTLQIGPVLDILIELDWTYVVIVHSDDVYGRTAADMLRTEGRPKGVCFIKSLEVSKTPNRDTLFNDLRAIQEGTQDGTLGVVYFGIWTTAEDLMEYYSRHSSSINNLYWLMSDSVGTMHDVFSGKGDAAVGTLTLSPSTVELKDLKAFWYTSSVTENQIVKEYLSQPGSNMDLMNATNSQYVAASVDAAYAYAVVLKQAHQRFCNGQRGVCDSLKNQINSEIFLQSIKDVTVNYSSLNHSFIPKEFIQQDRFFSFKESGDVNRGSDSVMYQVNSFTGQGHEKFVTVGTYSTNGLTLNKTAIHMKYGSNDLSGESLPKSVCEGYCKACVEFGHVPRVYIEGDVYIVGVFSLHESDNTDPFMCGKFRSVSSDTIALEAFIYAVQDMRKQTGINFGAVAFDDCYSSVRLTSIISEYFSSVGKPALMFDDLIPLNKTVAVVGSLSSGSTIPLARFFNSLNIPVISYAASSPDLDDRVNFPNFLRTVPSDVEQARAMVAIIQEMKWEYVSLLFVTNNYGTKGMQTFRTLATKAGICVLEPKNISETSSGNVDSSLYSVVDELVRENAKIVVFFGIDTRFEDFVRVVHEKREYGRFVIIASEDWGNKPDILDAGKRATRGAITLKIEPITIKPFPGFENYLLDKTPDTEKIDKIDPWFEEFWQHQFECNIRGGFNNIFGKECPSDKKLTKDEIQNHLNNQRVSHVQYAVFAAGMGVKNVKETLCRDFKNDFPCRFYYESEYTKRVWESIKQVKNPNLQSFMFDGSGNGAIGFTVYNVQDNDNDNLQYVEVGTFGGRGLEIDKEKVKFYDKLGYPAAIVAKCGTGSQCSTCEPTVTSIPAVEPPVATGTDPSFRVADIIIIVVVVVFIIVIIVALILAYRYMKTKVIGLSKEIQRYGNRDNDHIYQAVSDRMVYQNRQPSPERRPVPPPNQQHIYFVNGSHDNLHEPGGQINHGFRADDTLSQRNASGGTITSTGVTNPSSNSGQSHADSSSQSPRNTCVSPSNSGQLVMTETPHSLSPRSEVLPNGHIPNGILSSPELARPTTLHLHQNPRFVDMRQTSIDNGHLISPSMNHMIARPDLQHMPESYVGSPTSTMSVVSDTRHMDPHTSPSHVILNHHAQPVMVADPSILQSLANQQAALDQQAAYTALELQRLQLLQQQSALNQHPSNPYIPLSSAESRPQPPQYQHSQTVSPTDRPRPRTNPQHMTSNLNRVLTHHGSVDSLRSSGRSHGAVQNLATQDTMELTPETIPMQSMGQESKISRV